LPHKINSTEGRPVQVGTDRSVQRKGAEPATDLTAKIKADGTDAVHITGSAKQLAALEHVLKDQPIVNEARVAKLRAAIEGGTYIVDAARVADKLLLMEEQLANAAPKQ
jgi:negative regulator of flagellin synthesis FlgM